MTDTKRTLTVTAGNLKNSHLRVNGHSDFFPKEAFGGPKRKKDVAGGIEIYFEGLNQTVTTDIATEAGSGKPRFLRCRGPVRLFYQFHEIKPGAQLSLERLGEHQYRLSVPSAKPTARRRILCGHRPGPFGPGAAMLGGRVCQRYRRGQSRDVPAKLAIRQSF